MASVDGLAIIGGRSHPDFTNGICKFLDIKPVGVYTHVFSNQNIKKKIEDPGVRGKDVFIIQTGYSPYLSVSDIVVETCLLVDAAYGASARSVNVVFAYLPYVRSDKKDEERTAAGARAVIRAIEANGAHRFIAMDLHAKQIRHFTRDARFDELSSCKVMCKALQRDKVITPDNGKIWTTVSPDAGARGLNEELASMLGIHSDVVMGKTRPDDDEDIEIPIVIGDVEGKNVLLRDDEIMSGKTLIRGSKELRKKGAKNCIACSGHGLFTVEGSLQAVCQAYDEVYVTDSIPQPQPKESPPNFHVESVVPLFAQTILHIHTNRSVSTLLKAK